MTAQLSSRIMVLLSMTFGIVVAAFAIAGAAAVGIVAVIGAMVLGLLWGHRPKHYWSDGHASVFASKMGL